MIPQLSFYLAAVPAVILLGMSKGGFAGVGMLGLPLMALAIPPLQAAAIILPVLLVQDAFSVWVYRRTWDGPNLSVLLPGAAAGVIIGYLLAARVSNAGVSLAVGLLSAFFASARLIKAPAEPLASARPSRVVGMLCGGLSGFYKYDRACGRSAFSNLRSSAAARTRHFRGHQRHILRGGELDEALAIRCAWTDDTREYSYISQLVSPCPGFDMGWRLVGSPLLGRAPR
jgi:hypothetical protein